MNTHGVVKGVGLLAGMALLMTLALWLESAGATRVTGLWSLEAKPYTCAGSQAYVLCHSRPVRGTTYRVMVDGKRLWVSYGGTLIYRCPVKGQPVECETIP